MPCEYATINLKERERQEAEERQIMIDKRKRALIIALNAIGFDTEATSSNGRTLITGTKE